MLPQPMRQDDESRELTDPVDYFLDRGPDLIEAAFKLLGWTVLIAAIAYSASQFPRASARERLLDGVASAATFGSFLWTFLSLSRLMAREVLFKADRFRSEKKLLAAVFGSIAASTAIVAIQAVLVNGLVDALSLKLAH